MPEHGGNLSVAQSLYAHVEDAWVDLSTGINPDAYPVPAVPLELWSQLPKIDPVLTAAAASYYGARHVLAVAGSQAAIRAIPHLIGPARVLMPTPQYNEHVFHWREAGHSITEVPWNRLEHELPGHDWLVLCNPNNPTGERVPRDRLLDWAGRLHARGGGLVVDEAFADGYSELSLACESHRPRIIVLRSFGKFFGLAGARVGFVLAEAYFLARLQHQLGPWPLSGPAQYIARLALSDAPWQHGTRQKLQAAGLRLKGLLAAHGIESHGTVLFQSWEEPRARALQHFFAKQGIWVRAFDNERIRVGLPPDETAWQRLHHALSKWRAE